MFIFRWIGKFFRFIATCLGYFNKTLIYVLEAAVIIALIFGAASYFRTPQVQQNSVLVLDLEGSVRESISTESPFAATIAPPNPQASLHEITATLDKAAKDPLIAGVLLKLDHLDRIGLASIEEIGQSLERYKLSGKPLWAWGTNYSQVQYALAAHANEIYMHPMGEVLVKGLASNRLYYGELLNALGVNVHVFKAGAYKSFPESFVSSKPSNEWLESERFWLNDAWKNLSTNIERSRGLMPGAIAAYIDQLPKKLKLAKGDMASAALNDNLIDGTKTFDQMLELIAGKLGLKNKPQPALIHYADYRADLNSSLGEIAVVVAEGEIREGESQSGIIGSDTLVGVLDEIRENTSVKALVLRVNSPGGSAVASELIRHALERVKAQKPVVISMGDLAASGGFWISMGGSKVMASPVTVTGSIGVFGLAPTFEKTLGLAKIGQGSVATTWLANAEKPTQPMDPRLENILTQSVARTYNNFIDVVSNSRKLSAQYVESVAEGRVWTGSQALQRKLIDQVGTFNDAINLAKNLAKLDKNASIVYFFDQPDNFSSMIKDSLKDWGNPLNLTGLPNGMKEQISEAKTLLENSSKARTKAVYAHSLIEPLN